ncbi:MAG: hypothetical protein V4696_08750 [Pseudomonadota bacterium]
MYKLILAASATSLVLATPAAADPGKKKGQGRQAQHGQMVHEAPGKHQAKRSKTVYQGRATANYWGNRACPPGLAKKNNGCLPPGIAKRSFNVGDRWNGNQGQWSYNQVPSDWRNQYNLDSDNRYYYLHGYLYSVDPKTRLVESVIQALIR